MHTHTTPPKIADLKQKGEFPSKRPTFYQEAHLSSPKIATVTLFRCNKVSQNYVTPKYATPNYVI